jgi:hypothetical protein
MMADLERISFRPFSHALIVGRKASSRSNPDTKKKTGRKMRKKRE